jgi:hypothetical protein
VGWRVRRERDSQARLPARAETTPRHLVTRPDILEVVAFRN